MKLLLVILLVSKSLFSYCQTFEEWTQQKKTQIKYLVQQIAANKVYIEYVQKGYLIVNKGLATIRNIKNGDFNLHRDFFGSLKQLNPRIKKYVKVVDIIAYQMKIIKEIKKTMQGIKETGQLTADELDYCKMVFENLLEECLKNVEELIIVIGDDELEMKDDERIKRIDALYADMQNKYAFSSSFSEEMGLLSVQRLGEQIEINRSKILIGLQ